MAMVTSMSPAGNTYLSQTLSFEKRNSLRDPSFSSYLSNDEQNLVLKLTEFTQEVSPTTQRQSHHLYLGRLKDMEDGEIDIFGAEKYFQGEKEESTRKLDTGFSTRHQHEKDSRQVKSTPYSSNYLVSAVNEKKQLGTLSVRSESSVNSRSSLLLKIPRNQARGKINKGRHVKSFLTSLGCNCNDKASVVIDELSVENRARREEMTKPPLTTVGIVQKAKSMSSSTWADEEIHGNLKTSEDCFSFPVLNSNPGILAAKNQLQEGEKEKNPLSLQRIKLNKLGSWDVLIPREEEIKILSNGMHNDAESDASSDLFEIESFSTNGNSVLARQASDGMSGCMTPTTCYAPSEASIEWSVVTASAADCSILSDYEGVTGKPKNLDRMVRNAKIGKAGKDMQKKRPGILSGCTSLKAVRVVGNEYRTTGEKAISGSVQGRDEFDFTTPVTRFRAETKLTGSDFARGHRALPHSHSPHLMYIQ